MKSTISNQRQPGNEYERKMKEQQKMYMKKIDFNEKWTERSSTCVVSSYVSFATLDLSAKMNVLCDCCGFIGG